MKNKKAELLIYTVALTIVCGCAQNSTSSMSAQTTLSEENTDAADIAEEETSTEIIEEIEAESPEEAEEIFKNLLEAEISAEDEGILQIFTDDYDGDGICEAFAFTGVESEDEWQAYTGRSWFINHEEATVIMESDLGVENPGKVIDFGNRKYYTINEMYATARVTSIYTVRNNQAVEEEVSKMGDMAISEGNDCTISQSCYDTMYDAEMDIMLGHSWKMYYFHYSPDEDAIIEYKGREITADEAKALCPDGLLEEIEADSYTIDKIFIRENGILNINISNSDEVGNINYGNVNYDTVNGKYISAWRDDENTWQNSDFGGSYSASMFE